MGNARAPPGGIVNISRRERLAVLAFALALAALTSLPYLCGQLGTPDGWAYSGAPALPVGSVVDYNSHLAKMWQGARGQWDYHLLFTHEPHRGIVLVQGFYVALGALTRLTPFTLPLVYHIARFLLIFGMVLALWAFARHFFEGQRERWLALLFATVVSGWSWLLLFIDPALSKQVSPIEFWLSDAYNLFGALFMPHFAAAVILQIVIVLSFEVWIRNHRDTEDTETINQSTSPAPMRQLIILTLALAADAIVQPYIALMILPLLATLTAYYVFSAKRLSLRRMLWLVIPFGVHAGLVLYQYLALNGDPFWANFTAQNQTLSPLVTYYLLGYLPFILPMALGLRVFMVGEADDRWWMPIIWVGFVAMLLYAPFPTQRRYLLGVQTPLAVMAAYGWSRGVLPRIKRSYRPLLTAIYVTLAAVAMLGIWFANVGATNPKQNPSLYYSPDELRAFDWLRADDPTHERVVLTTFSPDGTGSGGRLVAATGQRVFIGHWIETLNFEKKVEQVRQFYDPATSDTWRQDFLKQIGAGYVWYDEYARRVGAWNPATAPYVEAAFTSDTVIIYRVKS
jgi:hypothetical protein